jgi:hypothetical protein
MLSLQLQKSPTPDFEEKYGNSPDISKGISQLGMCKFESSQVSQAVRRSEKLSLILVERPANGGLLRIGHQSPGSDFGHSRSEIADSLPRTFEKLPFLGDCGRRPGSICTAWPTDSAIRQILRLGRWQVGNAEPALPHPVQRPYICTCHFCLRLHTAEKSRFLQSRENKQIDEPGAYCFISGGRPRGLLKTSEYAASNTRTGTRSPKCSVVS